MTIPMLNSVAPETSVSLRSATPSGNRWWPSNISLRAPLRWPGVCPSGRCLPRPKVRSHTRRPLALPTVFLRKAAQGHRFLASAGSIRRTGSACRSERSFSGPLPRSLGGSVRGSRGAGALHTSKTIYVLSMSRSKPALPSEQWRPERGTIAATRTGRPTRSLKRTAEAFSGDSGLWSLSLRGAARAFMGHSLSSYTLAVLNFFVLVVVAGRLSRE